MPNAEQRANIPVSRRTFLKTALRTGAAVALLGSEIISPRVASAKSTPSPSSPFFSDPSLRAPSFYPQATDEGILEPTEEAAPPSPQTSEGDTLALEPQLASPLPLSEIQVEPLGEGKMLVVGAENPAAGAFKGEKLPVIARDGLVGIDFKTVSGIPRVTLARQRGQDSFNFAVDPDSGRVQFVRRDGGNRQVVAQQGNLLDLLNSREPTSVDVVYEGNRAWGMINGEVVLRSDKNHVPEGETYAYVVRSTPYSGVDTAVLLTNLRVASLADSDPSRYSSLLETNPNVVGLPDFLKVHPEMAGSIYDLKILKKDVDPNKPGALDNPDNYLPGLTIPAEVGRYYRVFSMDLNRIPAGSNIETATFAFKDGVWGRAGEYNRITTSGYSNLVFVATDVYDPERAKQWRYWFRVKVNDKIAFVQEEFIK